MRDDEYDESLPEDLPIVRSAEQRRLLQSVISKKVPISSALYGVADRTGKGTRLGILLELLDDPNRSRKEICDRLEINHINLQQHLEKLKGAGLISIEHGGRILVLRNRLDDILSFFGDLRLFVAVEEIQSTAATTIATHPDNQDDNHDKN